QAAPLPVVETPTHILPVMIGDAEQCKAASDRLLSVRGIYIQPINYPTVPRGTERLRITPTPHHNAELIAQLCDALVETWAALEIPLVEPVTEETAATARIAVHRAGG
ncbi:aminotransferase class I/II-fold pyridoxal phosphate-dependent enzyme, partial [Parvularcula marina]|uniref:aminotransferase class I/II-fold pyridoxal phosphate-dependent enzyme n=1 Tax=Parvularcula marina TaxID=2292771 RepID=UPI0035162958